MKVAGRVWREWVDLDELMLFFALLLEFTLRPSPGKKREEYWSVPDWHPTVLLMTYER